MPQQQLSFVKKAPSKPVTHTRVPQELIDEIIGQLAHDIPSLSACLRTSRSFREPAEKLIFGGFELHRGDDSGNKNTIERGNTLLMKAPHIAAFRLSITPSTYLMEWDSLSPGLAAAFTNTISLSSLQELRLRHIANVPVEIIHLAASSVRVLTLEGVSISSDHPTSSKHPLTPTLEHLGLLSIPGSIPLPLRELVVSMHAGGYLERLTQLSFSFRFATDASRSALRDLQPLLPPIQRLVIDYHNYSPAEFVAVPCPSLRILELSFAIPTR
ncbi:hypothetical protein C8F01DRAFT_1271531 [Mycena amicta]|nr:hypothetical protein C8F01DRAFT_1271531 [Mycena amicta]